MLDLLNQTDATIFRVLCEPCLMAAIRNSCPQFVKFITSKENMAILMDIVLTNKYCQLENYNQILKSALILLTSQTTGVMSPIMMNMVYMSKIFEFVNLSEVRDPQISGNFLKIVLSMAKYTRGEFLRDIPDFENWLINNCYTFAQKELLSSILIEYPRFININTEFAMKLAIAIRDQKESFVGCAVMNVFKNSPDFILNFQNDQVVEVLFEILNDKTTKLYKIITTFMLLYHINLFDYQIPIEMIEKYSKIFLENYEYTDCILSYALLILRTKDENILSKIFDPAIGSRLKMSIFKQFDYMSNDELYDYICQSQLNLRILELAQNKRRDVSITLFKNLIHSRGIFIEGWNEGLQDLGLQLDLYDTEYGGELSPPLEVNYSLLASDKIITL
ncbi:hypothetical protein TVAG_147040 [Trichomonas vaginalis G3]|uniref:Uncharacterized protein n=1 Tax=Trichomonas vaginalis (strain ATCC PRA-98 / G3) TaxID=412133 RepID=A2DL07_TRIV3|nr:hypothetical protein TVAGG3_0362300 [Trichomonas vaginalis G3]EAY18960.1 hypothetical protein TVAG_147040 [Trichomonas vaginalis G3]KAI5532026.1 hypothetical protein TVAGG3_0362300 [Trichomonas vaginalis G3]|eukprot:XP_001579946.1 hypothetical protein [Trichomonas vaginalis G3]